MKVGFKIWNDEGTIDKGFMDQDDFTERMKKVMKKLG